MLDHVGGDDRVEAAVLEREQLAVEVDPGDGDATLGGLRKRPVVGVDTMHLVEAGGEELGNGAAADVEQPSAARTTRKAVSWRKPFGTWITSPVGSRHSDFSSPSHDFFIPLVRCVVAGDCVSSADEAAADVRLPLREPFR